jgi:cytochrome c oxidase cbb3-type subunit 4
MPFDHDTVLWFSKTFGLFYLIALAIGVVVYAYWPSNRKHFDRAALSVLNDEDKPCR